MKRQAGFSLIEVAVAVSLLTLLAGLGLQVWRASSQLSATIDTRNKLDQVQSALQSFFRTNGRLPCPDTTANPTGIEPATCTTLASGYGVVPWASLGIPKSAVLDGWSNFFTYRVSVSSPAAAAPAAPLVPRAANNLQNWAQRNLVPPPNAGFNIGSLTSPNTGGFRAIQVDERNAGIVSTSAFHAVATLVSHGPSGAGARTSNGVLMALPPAGSDELVNASASNPPRVVIRSFTDSTAAVGGVYDDIVVYLTPQNLLQPLLDDKSLRGICNAYCPSPPGAAGCSATGIPVGNATMICP
ncbi:MAG: hypothetical protein RIR09_177 [Pseudomonadota bacterium]|jgi:prepilin-type N-terminal cleavage/methylation domain-containing protein